MPWVKKQTLVIFSFVLYNLYFTSTLVQESWPSDSRHDFVRPWQMFSAGSSCAIRTESPFWRYAHHWSGGAFYANSLISWVCSDQVNFVWADPVDLSEIARDSLHMLCWEIEHVSLALPDFPIPSLPSAWVLEIVNFSTSECKRVDVHILRTPRPRFQNCCWPWKSGILLVKG